MKTKHESGNGGKRCQMCKIELHWIKTCWKLSFGVKKKWGRREGRIIIDTAKEIKSMPEVAEGRSKRK
jgi:hypothetical protein